MKKGFTLVEIIISIAIIVAIGIGFTFFVINTNKNKEIDILVANESNFSNALEVYLSTNSYVVDNIYDNAEGAVISLEVLKNEGLISDNLEINYEDNYFVVSNAFLGNENLGENVVKEECESSIGLTKVASWASSNDTTGILYFCPKDEGGGIDKVNELLCSDIPYEEGTLEYTIICNAKKINERWQTSYRDTPYTEPGAGGIASYEQILTKTEDDYGTSYYYRGNVIDNYVNFAGRCWRIVRVQGDGSVKLLHQNGTNCEDIGFYVYPNYQSGNYGYKYADINGVGYNDYVMNYLEPFTNATKSMVRAFYSFQNNLSLEAKNKMKSGDWCLNDKAYKSYDLSQELQVYDYSTHMFYDSNVRLGSASTLQPTLKCRGTQMKKFKNVIVDGVHITAEIDMYVATLTADEIVFAGESLIYGNGQQTFLTALDSFEYDVHNYSTNSIGFWTLSPWYFRVGGIDDSGDSVLTISNYPYPQISKFLVSEDCGFRPAIVLKKGNVLDENVSGQNGTREHPYVIG